MLHHQVSRHIPDVIRPPPTSMENFHSENLFAALETREFYGILIFLIMMSNFMNKSERFRSLMSKMTNMVLSRNFYAVPRNSHFSRNGYYLYAYSTTIALDIVKDLAIKLHIHTCLYWTWAAQKS